MRLLLHAQRIESVDAGTRQHIDLAAVIGQREAAQVEEVRVAELGAKQPVAVTARGPTTEPERASGAKGSIITATPSIDDNEAVHKEAGDDEDDRKS